MAFLTAGGVDMPCPTALKVDHEIIWSANTGRTSDGTMVGDVVAEKKTVEVTWGILTDAEMKKISQYMTTGFFDIRFKDFGGDVTITGYRGTLSGQALGAYGGTHYWKSASVKIIQQ